MLRADQRNTKYSWRKSDKDNTRKVSHGQSSPTLHQCKKGSCRSGHREKRWTATSTGRRTWERSSSSTPHVRFVSPGRTYERASTSKESQIDAAKRMEESDDKYRRKGGTLCSYPFSSHVRIAFSERELLKRLNDSVTYPERRRENSNPSGFRGKRRRRLSEGEVDSYSGTCPRRDDETVATNSKRGRCNSTESCASIHRVSSPKPASPRRGTPSSRSISCSIEQAFESSGINRDEQKFNELLTRIARSKGQGDEYCIGVLEGRLRRLLERAGAEEEATRGHGNGPGGSQETVYFNPEIQRIRDVNWFRGWIAWRRARGNLGIGLMGNGGSSPADGSNVKPGKTDSKGTYGKDPRNKLVQAEEVSSGLRSEGLERAIRLKDGETRDATEAHGGMFRRSGIVEVNAFTDGEDKYPCLLTGAAATVLPVPAIKSDKTTCTHSDKLESVNKASAATTNCKAQSKVDLNRPFGSYYWHEQQDVAAVHRLAMNHVKRILEGTGHEHLIEDLENKYSIRLCNNQVVDNRAEETRMKIEVEAAVKIIKAFARLEMGRWLERRSGSRRTMEETMIRLDQGLDLYLEDNRKRLYQGIQQYPGKTK